MTGFNAEISAEVTACLAGLVEEFVEELDGPPTLSEFLQILSLAMPETDALAGALVPPVRFAAKLADDQVRRGRMTSRVEDLNDAVFAEASQFLAGLAASARDAAGKPIRLAVLGEGVARAVRAAEVAFADVSGGDIATVTAKAATGVRAAVGDVIAIPSGNGGYHLAVLITRNRFGMAVGIFRSVVPEPSLGAMKDRAVWPYPVYTDDSRVIKKKWLVAGHDESLLSLFPAKPEVYHGTWELDSGEFGEFGLAETIDPEATDEALRTISEEESRAVGVVDGTYRQYLNPDLFERFLQRFE